jgi:uncharacterized protein
MCFRLATYALTFALAFVCAAAPTDTSAGRAANQPAQAQDSEFSHGVLWKIEAKGAPPSYLFGTIHTDDDRVLVLPAAVQNAFDGAADFAAEVVGDEAAVRKFVSAMVTREPHLPQLLGDADYALVDHLLAEHNIPTEARPRFKPWAAMITLLQPSGATGLVLDRVLLHEAQQRGKRVHALEVVEEQIAALDGMAEASQVRLLQEIVTHYPDIEDTIGALIEAYLARDLEALWQLNAKTMGEDAAVKADNELFLQRVLFARNQRFAERLAPLLRNGNAFAAFGALHLYGERGVLSLLQQRGFKVQRVY